MGFLNLICPRGVPRERDRALFSTIDFLLFVSEEGNSKQADACRCGVAVSSIASEFRQTKQRRVRRSPSAACLGPISALISCAPDGSDVQSRYIIR